MPVLEIKQTAVFQKWEGRLKDRLANAAIAARIFRLANGLPGDVQPVGDGVSELRIHYGPGYRVYFQQRGNALVVLLCGGDKRTQSRDIQTAKRLVTEWSNGEVKNE
jgi:putative addiction module killer protein